MDVDAIGFRTGRRGATYTDVHDWVTFSHISPGAKALYVIYRAHVNRQRDDDTVWTSTLALALVMGYSRGDKIKQFTDELVEIDAIARERSGLHGRNVFTVNEQPPPGYTGPKSPAEWHARNKRRLDELRAVEKAARDARRARAKAKTSPTGAENSRSQPVHPDRGEQAVAPDRGELVTLDRGEPVPPVSGREPNVLEPDVLEPIPPTPRDTAAAPTVDQAVRGENELDKQTRTMLNDAVDAAAAVRATSSGWSAAAIRKAVRLALEAGHDVDTVLAALPKLAADAQGTDYPGRLPAYLSAQARETVATARPAEGPYRHQALPRDVKRCPVHPDQAAKTCDLEGHPDGTITSEQAAQDLAAVRAILRPGTSLSRYADRPPAVPVQTSPADEGSARTLEQERQAQLAGLRRLMADQPGPVANTVAADPVAAAVAAA